MTLTAFLAYCAAVTLAAATPGPAMFAVITNGVSRGFLRAFIAGVGVAAGDAVLVTL
ncbi:LysE family translocator, partial [Mesorhizobium sp. M8A.F.Ca.ET.059.01.1.1]